jgi:sterol desaturase/sphingolipid hydroxylase (fatty acid hydroxylase superfamily)
MRCYVTSSTKSFLWTLPQPIFVLGSTLLIVSSMMTGWVEPGILFPILLYLPIPLLLMMERLVPRRKDWLLNWRDLGMDSFWVLSSYLIWFPFFDEHYETPISTAFAALRNAVDFPVRLQPETTLELFVAVIVAVIAIEFIGYWLHRAQHRFMFLWRIHATHHHITKMSVARADRTHPLELLGLNLGPAIALAMLGASDVVIGATLIFRITNGYTNHANLPLESGVFGWVFNTAEMHQLHHSCNFEESNTNYGCTVILWDRIFGTFSGQKQIERTGNGTGNQLSLLTQYTLPFRSNKVLKEL